MKRLIVAFIIGLLLGTAGFAGADTAGLLSYHEQKQDTKIAELRHAVKQLWRSDQWNTYRLDMADCNNDACRQQVQYWFDNSEGWPGWSHFDR